MDVTLPNGQIIQGVPEGASQAEVKKVAIANGLASAHDFDVHDQTSQYQGDIGASEQANGLPPGLLNSLISKESSGNPNAISSAGAIGLGQTLPSTLVDMGYDEQQVAANPSLQIEAAGKYLGQMLKATNGNVADALTAYHSGLGNLAKYQSGEKQMGPAAAGYATDPRFARFVQAPPQEQQQAQQQDPQAAANQQLFADAAAMPQGLAEPAPDAPLGEQVADAGRGLLQAGVNVANIPGSVVNTALGAAGVAPENQVMTMQLPENLRPRSEMAKLGAEIGPYLIPIPGVQAESVAQAAARGSDAIISKVAGVLERNVPKSIAENTVGALAQNASSGNQNGFGDDIAVGTGASLAVRGAGGLVSRSAQAVRDAVQARRAAKAAASDTPPPAAGAGDAPPPSPDAPPVDAGSASGAAPSTVPASAAAVVGSTEEEALRNLAIRSNPADPNLASSLDGLNIAPRAEVQEAADRLGVDNLLPSHLSGNAQYQAVEQAIKSRKGSGLKVQEDEAITKLANAAGKTMDEISGMDSAAGVSSKLRGEYETRLSSLEKKSDVLYKRVDEAVPAATVVEAPQTAKLLEQVADDLGGWKNLSTHEKRIFEAVSPAPGAEDALTYGRLNRLRQDLGAAIYKNEGIYKDVNKSALKRIYGALREDQQRFLDSKGVGRDFEVANKLVGMRKNLEDKMIKLHGKDLTGDATRKTQLAVAALAKGDSGQFRKLFEPVRTGPGKMNTPVIQFRAQRQALIADGIREQLSAGKRGTDFSPAGFADWYGNMQKNGGLALISKHMPPGFMAQLKDTFTVADAIRRAKSHEVTTGALNDFTRRFDRVNANAKIISDHAGKAGAVLGGFVSGGIGAGAGLAIGSKIAGKAAKLGGAEAGDAAEKLIASVEYQNAVKKLAGADASKLPKVKAEEEAKLKKSKAYQRLMQQLPKGERGTLARLGLISWANSEDTNED